MAKNAKSRSTRAGPPKGSRARLRGRGDYAADITDDPDMARRLEKKIDHLEKSLVHATPSTNRAASLAGRALGSLVGQGDLGAYAGSSLSKLLGFGDYSTKIKGNSLMAGVAGNSVPKFQGDGRRGTRITEIEFLGNVVAGPVVSNASVFTNTSYKIIPTDPDTFPWLSQIAHLFDQWEPNGIVFEYRTTSSTFNGNSQALGAVVMATDYDPLDDTYTSKQQMENADYACSTVPSTGMLHGVECDKNERPLEVMYTSFRKGQENFSSLGNFQIATQGCSVAGVVLGELWVSYDITFYKKQLVDPTVDTRALNYLGTSVINAPWINTLVSAPVAKGITYEASTNRYYFPPSQGTGTYLIEMWTDSNGTNDFSPAANNLVNTSVYTHGALAGSPRNQVWIYNITAPGAWFSPGIKNTTAGKTSLLISEITPGMLLTNPL